MSSNGIQLQLANSRLDPPKASLVSCCLLAWLDRPFKPWGCRRPLG